MGVAQMSLPTVAQMREWSKRICDAFDTEDGPDVDLNDALFGAEAVRALLNAWHFYFCVEKDSEPIDADTHLGHMIAEAEKERLLTLEDKCNVGAGSGSKRYTREMSGRPPRANKICANCACTAAEHRPPHGRASQLGCSVFKPQ